MERYEREREREREGRMEREETLMQPLSSIYHSVPDKDASVQRRFKHLTFVL